MLPDQLAPQVGERCKDLGGSRPVLDDRFQFIQRLLRHGGVLEGTRFDEPAEVADHFVRHVEGRLVDGGIAGHVVGGVLDEEALVVQRLHQVGVFGHREFDVRRDASAAVDGAPALRPVGFRFRLPGFLRAGARGIRLAGLVPAIRDLLDQPPARGVVPRGRDLQGRPVVHGEDLLHRGLAERRPAGHDPPVPVLYGAGDDLGGAGAEPVDEDHQRRVRERVAVGSVIGSPVGARTPLCVHDEPVLFQKLPRHADGLLQQAARVAAQVEQVAPGALVSQPFQRSLDFPGGLFGELVQLDVADIAVQNPHVRDHRYGNDGAREGIVDELGFAFPADRYRHRGPRAAPEEVRGLGHVDVGRGPVFDPDDAVADLQPDVEGRRVVEQRDDDEGVLLPGLGDLDAQSSVLALDLHHLHFIVLLLLEKLGVGIQRAQHAFDGRVDRFALVQVVHVLGAYAFHDLVQQFQIVLLLSHRLHAFLVDQPSGAEQDEDRQPYEGDASDTGSHYSGTPWFLDFLWT